MYDWVKPLYRFQALGGWGEACGEALGNGDAEACGDALDCGDACGLGDAFTTGLPLTVPWEAFDEDATELAVLASVVPLLLEVVQPQITMMARATNIAATLARSNLKRMQTPPG